ncbi:MAG: orotate phosphoribosyltransferase [Chitinophagales bacterium]|nr:orotate phosphoribosyltransferase [Chitinophagales bacterium]
MILNESVAQKMAGLLLQINAVRLNLNEPFTWSSGWKSPIYCDNRLSLSFPEIRTFIKEEISNIINLKFPDTELIAGVATAGIAHGALVADYLETPFCYVRSSSKGHGLGNSIEGLVVPGQKAIVVEDLISTGGSGISVIDSLRGAGCEVTGLIAIFTYGFPEAEKKLLSKQVLFYTLTDYDTLLNEALSQGVISGDQLSGLQQWRMAPSTWEGLR